jgi:hypothetical protein
VNRAKVKATKSAEPSKQILRGCLWACVFVAAIFAGYAAWDQIGTMHFEASTAADGGAGYDNNFFPKSSGRTSNLGYSTGPDDKGYLKLPGVPDSPRRAR